MRTVRIFYSKKDRMKFVSHLDMNRYVTRLVKVSGIPARHTEGFHQHLYLTFALPLSLGITSDYDMFDMKITDDDFTNEQILEALQKNAAEGITILAVDEPKMNASEIAFAEYTLEFKDADQELLSKLEALFKCNVILATKKGKKGKTTEINVAEKIVELKTLLSEKILRVDVILPAGNTENINPTLVLQSFLDAGNRKPEVCKVNRNIIFNASKEIFK